MDGQICRKTWYYNIQAKICMETPVYRQIKIKIKKELIDTHNKKERKRERKKERKKEREREKENKQRMKDR